MTDYIVATSDWHLDARTAGASRRADLHAAANAVADRVVELAKARPRAGRRGAAFVFAGDLCDPYRASSHAAVACAVGVACRLAEWEVEQVWMPGNHDVVEDGSGDDALLALEALNSPYVSVVREPSVVVLDGGVPVVCLPYPSRARLYDPEVAVRGVDMNGADPARPVVVAGHLTIDGITPGSETAEMARGRELMWPVKAIRERWPKAVVLGGHYHRSQEHGGVRFLGALGRFSFDEEDHEPGYVVVDVRG